MGERPEGTTLDRKNKEKNYCPSNCRWATVKEQNNNKGNNRTFIYKGMEKTIAEWAEWAGLTYDTLWFRIRNNCSLEKALNTPQS
jgi:hypothetical protein